MKKNDNFLNKSQRRWLLLGNEPKPLIFSEICRLSCKRLRLLVRGYSFNVTQLADIENQEANFVRKIIHGPRISLGLGVVKESCLKPCACFKED
jgi:hypothetical protein